MNEPKKYDKKVMCRMCQQETWHTVINQVKVDTLTKASDVEIPVTKTFLTLQCRGCDNVCLLISNTDHDCLDPQTGEPATVETIHPTPFRSDREILESYHIPDKVKTIYEETIKAFNEGLLILSAVGVRTVIEALAIEQNIKVRGIASKIRRMVEEDLITQDNANLLDLVRYIGNLATHEIKKQHKYDLSLCIDIVENIIKNLYIHPQRAKESKEMIKGGWKRA